jgi:RNA polymerase sigma-70 factor, ECF subfamily
VSVAIPAVSRMDSEAGLIRRAQHGDSNAFANIFHNHKPRVYSLCLRMTNNVAEAEDLTQEAFLQVFRKLPTFRGDSALSTWMYRVAVNTVLMYFRKRGRPQISLDEPVNPTVKTKKREYGFDDQQLVTSIDRITLARAIKELPRGYRRIFLLHEIEGYEHREIARRLRCSVGNSKSQLHKARLKMREILTQAPETDLGQAPTSRHCTKRMVLAKPAGNGPRTLRNGARPGKDAAMDKSIFILPQIDNVGIPIAA